MSGRQEGDVMSNAGAEPQSSTPEQPHHARVSTNRRSPAAESATALQEAEALEAYEAVVGEYRPALDRLGQDPGEGPARLSDSAN